MERWIIGEREVVNGGTAGVRKVAEIGAARGEDGGIERQRVQEPAGAVGRVPGIVGEIVRRGNAVRGQVPEGSMGERGDAGGKHEAGLEGARGFDDDITEPVESGWAVVAEAPVEAAQPAGAGHSGGGVEQGGVVAEGGGGGLEALTNVSATTVANY